MDLITNYLILQPSVEMDFAFSDDKEIGVGSGLNSIETSLRLSYDLIDRAISPYIGVAYERKLGRTKNIARAEDEDVEVWNLVIGIKFMF